MASVKEAIGAPCAILENDRIDSENGPSNLASAVNEDEASYVIGVRIGLTVLGLCMEALLAGLVYLTVSSLGIKSLTYTEQFHIRYSQSLTLCSH